MQKKWNIKGSNPLLQVKLGNILDIPPIVAQLLINRQIQSVQEARDFLKGDLTSLHDPFLLKDMDRAVERIKKAKRNGELVLIYGDYDVDGLTSSALLNKIFTKMGIKVINHIPNRITDGYGLNLGIIDIVQQNGVSLVISVDCGINAFDVVEDLGRRGVDVIIVDHHEPDSTRLPGAVAIIDPKRQDCSYPFKNLAAIGLVFKLSQALLGEVAEDDLDLVALGTIADVVELRGENRIFVKKGLPKVAETKNKGLRALLDVAKIKDKQMRPYYVGFILGPRLNATGRMGSADMSLQLLLTDDDDEAYSLARSLDKHNMLRQRTQNNIVQEAVDIVESTVNFKEDKIIVLSKEGWHKGVVGIVASRILDKYYRPAIVVSLENGLGTGSARSIEGFHMYDALSQCADCLERYGGHQRAAGLTLREENIDIFRDAINTLAKGIMSSESLVPTLNIDCEVPLSSLCTDLVKAVDMLEPFGEGNPSPLFCSRDLMLKARPVVMGKDTLKFWVTDGRSTLPVLGFGMGRFRDLVNQCQKIDLAYSLFIDDWNKAPIVSLKLKDVKESGS